MSNHKQNQKPMKKTSTSYLEKKLSIAEWTAIIMAILLICGGAYIASIGIFHAYISLPFGWEETTEYIVIDLGSGLISLCLAIIIFFAVLTTTSKKYSALYNNA